MWTLGAWCKVRQGFRKFRLDRLKTLEELDEPFETAPGRSLDDYFDDLMGGRARRFINRH